MHLKAVTMQVEPSVPFSNLDTFNTVKNTYILHKLVLLTLTCDM